MKVTITSAIALTASQLSKIKTAISKKHGKSVEFEQVVDASIIGGIKIRFGSSQVDGTVSNQLELMEEKLLNLAN